MSGDTWEDTQPPAEPGNIQPLPGSEVAPPATMDVADSTFGDKFWNGCGKVGLIGGCVGLGVLGYKGVQSVYYKITGKRPETVVDKMLKEMQSQGKQLSEMNSTLKKHFGQPSGKKTGTTG